MGKKSKTKSYISSEINIAWTPSATIDQVAFRFNEAEPSLFVLADQSKSPPRAPEKPLLLLGGSNIECFSEEMENYKSHVPTTSVFRGLDRPDCLPKSSKSSIRAFERLKKKDQQIVKNFLLGPVCVVTKYNSGLDGGHLVALVGSQDMMKNFENGRELNIRGEIKLYFPIQSVTGIPLCSFATMDKASEAFVERLDDIQKEHLYTSVLHRFMRAYGIFLPMNICKGVTGCLAMHYSQSGLYPELVDIRTLAADQDVWQHFDSDNNSTMADRIGQVAEAMEACGQFATAAQLYVEAHDMWLRSIRPHNPDLPATLLQNAGLAFKRNGDFQLAEEYYIKGFSLVVNGTHPSEWDVNHGNASGLLSSLGILFFATGNTSRPESNVFIGLLIWAKYDYLDNFVLVQNGMGNFVADLVQDQFRNRQQATIAIFHLFKEGTVQSFQKELMKCRNETAVDLEMEVKPRSKKEEKLFARNGLPETGGTMIKCAEPGCTTTLAPGIGKSCPCKTVSYCSKECQVKHWKTHKKVCEWKKKQKEG